MSKDIREIPLDDVALKSNDDINQSLVDSGMSSVEQHLESHFIWFRLEYGFLGFERARDAVKENDATKAALELMQTMVEMITSDKRLHEGLTANEIRKEISKKSRHAALVRHDDPNKEEQLKAALKDVENMLKDGKLPDFQHNDFIKRMRHKYPLLAGNPNSKQAPRDKLRSGVMKLCEQYGRKVRGISS